MQSIILLHGALGAPADLEPLAGALSAKGLRVHRFGFSGHAGSAFAGSFGIPRFTDELAAFMQHQTPEGAHVFGYSMGGYVALNLALQPGHRMGKIVTLGTKFNWSKETVQKETAGLDPELMQQKVPAFAAALQQKHGDNWKEMVQRTAGLMRELSELDLLNTAALKGLQSQVLIGLGDRDKMITLEETLAVYQALPNAAMYMLPATKHPLETANISLLSSIIQDFTTGA